MVSNLSTDSKIYIWWVSRIRLCHCDSRFVRFEHKLFVLPRLEIDVFIKSDREMHHTSLFVFIVVVCLFVALVLFNFFFLCHFKKSKEKLFSSSIFFFVFFFFLSIWSIFIVLNLIYNVLCVHDKFVLTKSLCKQQRAWWSRSWNCFVCTVILAWYMYLRRKS